MHTEKHEAQSIALQDPKKRDEEFRRYAHYRPGIVARMIGGGIVCFGNVLYGRKPSYAKFRAIEIIARIPYQSWEVFSYCAQTIFFSDEKRAMQLEGVSAFARVGQDNETMHVVVISQLMRKHGDARLFRTTTFPMIAAFIYFYASFLLYFISKRTALEVNFVFENHAYKQYDLFLKEREAVLRATPINCDFLTFYGRQARSEYEFFELVRNDELIHRNASLAQIGVRG